MTKKTKEFIHDIVFIIFLLFVPGCAMFSTTPDSVKEAALYANKIAIANASNLQVINVQYYEAWLSFMKTHGATNEEMIQLTNLFIEISKRTEPLGRYGIEITRAIAEYLNTDGANLAKLIDTLALIKGALNE
ncbi:MAG TPA: hypothetical protein VMW10_04255 [Alphaproteobacteria bacterium]|nr:hypothetical protein [Alphaproteobacteria bacterium]